MAAAGARAENCESAESLLTFGRGAGAGARARSRAAGPSSSSQHIRRAPRESRGRNFVRPPPPTSLARARSLRRPNSVAMSRAEASAPLDPPSVPASPAAKFSTFSARVQAASQDAFDYAKRYGNPAGAASLHAGRGTAVLGHRQSPEAMTGALVAFATKLRAAESDRDAWKRGARPRRPRWTTRSPRRPPRVPTPRRRARAPRRRERRGDARARPRRRRRARAARRHRAPRRRAPRRERAVSARGGDRRARRRPPPPPPPPSRNPTPPRWRPELAAAEAGHAVRVDELNAAGGAAGAATRRRAANGERVRSKPRRGLVDAEPRRGDGDEDSTASTSRDGDDSNDDGGGGGGARIRDETQRLRETAARLAEANADLVRRLIDDGREEDGARRDGRRRSGRSRSRSRVAGTGSERSRSRAPRRGVVVARRRVVSRSFAREAPPATPLRPAFRRRCGSVPGGEGEPWEQALRRDDLSRRPARRGAPSRGSGPRSSSPRWARNTRTSASSPRGGGGYRWVPAKRWGRRGGDGGGVRSGEEAGGRRGGGGRRRGGGGGGRGRIGSPPRPSRARSRRRARRRRARRGRAPRRRARATAEAAERRRGARSREVTTKRAA